MSAELCDFNPISKPNADARLSEAHHRIANNLALVAGFARLQATTMLRKPGMLSANEAGALLEEVGARIETIGRLHRLLSRDPTSDLVEVSDYLRETCKALGESMSSSLAFRLSFDSDCDWDAPAEQAAPVALIVTELITNALKYAHPTGVAGRVAVRCRRGTGGAHLITVKDDGVGLPEDFDPESDGGLGLRVVHSLARQLNAQLIFESGELGVCVRLLVPSGEGPVAGMAFGK